MQLKILGLQGSKNIDLITSAIKGMSKAEVAATLVKTGLSSEEQIQILTKRGLLETEAKQLLSIAANKGIVKTSIGTITAIITALSLVYTIAKKVDEHFGISLKSSANKLSELKSESLELESELSSLNNELDTTSEKTKELEQKGTLSFTEKEELDNLKAQNAELERSIALLNLEAEAKNAEKNERFVSTMKKDMDKSSEYTYYNGAIIDQGLYSSSIAFGAENVGGATEKQYIQQQIDAYKDYLSQIAQLDEDYANDLTNETYNTQREALKKQADDIYDYLFEVNTRFAEYSDGISYITNPTTQEGRAVNEYLDYIRDFQNKLLVLSGNKSEVFNSLTEGAFSNAVSDLKELGKQGGVTAAELKNSKYEDFIDNLIEIGFISDNTVESLADVALAFNGASGEAASNGILAVEKYAAAYNNLLNEQKKIEDWGLSEYGDAFNGDSFSQKKFGNVDMDKRAILEWNEELKSTYKDALASWDYDPEIGNVDTVFGGSGRFGEDTLTNGVEIAFTPILQTEDGKGELLSKDTVNKYIEELIKQSTTNGKFSKESLLDLDKTGLKVDGKDIKGLIAEVDESIDGSLAKTTGKLMHFSGEFGSVKLAYKDIAKYAKEAGMSTEEFVETFRIAAETVKTLSIDEAFENWENAQGKVQSGVKFDTLLEALDLAYDTVSDKTSDVYEKIGNADYKAAIDLLIPVDAEIDETNLSAVKQRIDSTIKKYLKTDDSGNYTGLDVGKFLNASVAAGIMTKDGDNYSVNKGVTLESWAKELGLTMASVKAIMGELEEYGADFQLFDFDDDFETLAKNAKNAAVSLRSTLGEDFDLDLNFDLDSENVIGDIDSAIGTIEGKLKDKDIDPTTAVNLLKTLEYCVKQKQLLEQPVVMLIDTTQIEDDATRGAIKKLQNFITADNEYELKLKLGYDTTEAKKNRDKAIEDIKKSLKSGKLKDLDVNFEIDENSTDSVEQQIDKWISGLSETDFTSAFGIKKEAFEPALEAVESIATKIDQIFNGERTISFKASLAGGSLKITMDTSEANEQIDEIQDKVDGVTGHKTLDVIISNATRNTKKIVYSLLTKLIQIASKHWTVNVNQKTTKTTTESKTVVTTYQPLIENANPGKKFGEGLADGTSNFQGGTALVGELGREMAVDPNKGTWETVGDSGAEFVNLPKNAIVFNHKQTEQLLRNGKISSRGSAFAYGNAFANSSSIVAGSMNYTGLSGSGSNNSKNNKDNSSSKNSSKSSDNSKEAIDWIETLLERLGRVFDGFVRTVDDTSQSFSARTKALNKEISQIDKIISADKKAADIYLQKANGVGLSSSLQKKVQSGSYDISDYSSDTAEKIKQYKEYYEKYLEAIDDAAEKQIERAALQLEKFELIQKKYDSKFNLQDEKISYWEAVNEQGELNGKGGSIVAQDEMIAIYERRAKYLKEEKKELLDNLEGIEKGTEAWYETQAAIKSLDTEILNAENDIKKLKNVKIQIEYEVFEAKASKYDSKISIRDGNISILEAKYERAEKQGDNVAAINAKRDEIGYLKDKKKLLKDEKASLVKQLGNIKTGTEEWYKAKQAIQQIDIDLVNTDTAILEAEQAIEDIEWNNFEKISTDYDDSDKEYEQGLAMQAANNTRYELEFGIGSITAQKEMQNLEASHLLDLEAELRKLRTAMIGVSEEDENYEKMIQRIREVEIEIIESENQISQYDKAIKDILYSQFQNLGEQFDNSLSDIDHRANLLNSEIEALELQGYKVTSGYYKQQESLENGRLITLKDELKVLKIAFDDAMKTGLIKEGSKEWYEYQKKINSVNEELKETENNILEINKTMADLDYENFKYIRETVSKLNEEADFYIDLMSDSDMYDENGKFTKEGLATLGLHGQNYNVYMSEAEEYGKKLAEVEKNLANDPNNTLLIDKKYELIEAQRSSILSAQDEKQAMRDLVEDGINYELDALSELIDAYTDALDSAKDLHDYEKKIADHNTDISSIRKQIAAYSGDNSQEAKLKIQQLQADLKEAEEDLEETEYDRYISDQKELLNDFYEEYEKILNDELEDIDKLIADLTKDINANAGAISDTLDELSKKFGVSLSEDIKSVWDSNVASPILSTFLGENSDFSNKQTTISNTLSEINSRVDKILTAADKKYSTGDVPSPSAPDDNSNNTGKDDSSDSSDNQGDGLSATTAKDIIDNVLNGMGNFLHSGNNAPQQNENTSKFGVGDVIELPNVKAYMSPSEDLFLADLSGQYEVADTSNSEWIGIKGVGSRANEGADFWIKRSALNIPAYKNGGFVDYTGLAWVDGTKTNPEYMLNAEETKSFSSIKGLLSKLAEQEIRVSNGISRFGISEQIRNIPDMTGYFAKLKENLGTNEKSISIGDINIEIDHVQDYNDFVTQLKNDSKFEGLVQAVSIDLLNGKSRMAKNKYNWK